MKEGRPSFTAGAVAMARAIGGVDPLASALLGGPLGLVARAGRAGRAPEAVINAATLGLVDHVSMRTRALDGALVEAVGAGLRQLVLLGAGLDARAWRMAELAAVDVFEVDHPSTQAHKRARVGRRHALAREVRFVPVDFARDSLGEALAAAGHHAGASTFWLWEGVTPYLPREALRATLAAIAGRSAAGSRVAVTYATPQGSSLGPALMRAAHVAFRAIGESLLGLLSPEDMQAELGAAGFTLLEDLPARAWAARFDGGARRRLLLLDERLAIATSSAR